MSIGMTLFVGGPKHLQWISTDTTKTTYVCLGDYDPFSLLDPLNLNPQMITTVTYRRVRCLFDGRKFDLYLAPGVNDEDVLRCRNVCNELWNHGKPTFNAMQYIHNRYNSGSLGYKGWNKK